MYKQFARKLAFAIIFFCLFFTNSTFVGAETSILSSFVRGSNEIPIENLSDLNDTASNLESKTRIVLLPIKPTNLRYSNDCRLWLRSVVYYLTTRLGLKQLPTPLALCENGSLYELTTESYTRTTLMSGSSHVLYILYLDGEGGDLDLVANTVTKVITAFSMKEKSVEVHEFRIELNRNEESMQFKQGEDLTKKYEDLITKINQKYEKNSKLTGIEISSFSTVTKNPQLNSIVEMKLKLKNSSKIDIFDTSDITGGIYLTTINPLDVRSNFYAGESYWSSFSRIPIINKGDIFKSGETKDFILRFKYTSGNNKFAITNLNGDQYSGSEIGIDFINNNISIPNLVANDNYGEVQISDNPAGYINVRNLPNLNSEVIGKVYPKKKYPLLEISGLWYKVSIDGVSGWISSEYAVITKNISQ